jgi:hypothetical protein
MHDEFMFDRLVARCAYDGLTTIIQRESRRWRSDRARVVEPAEPFPASEN